MTGNHRRVQAGAITGVISGSCVLAPGRQKEFSRMAAVAHNLDHIASASTKPGTEAGKAIMHRRERGRMARMKTREIPWSGQ